MTQTESAVDWALDQGANAVEIDIAFNTVTGALKLVKHGAPCDCSCKCPAPLWNLCSSMTGYICSVLIHDVSKGSPCNAASSVSSLLRHLGSKNQLALIVIDGKIEKEAMREIAMLKAGRNMVSALKRYLFASGYGGKVIVGTPKLNTYSYLQGAVALANTYNGLKDRIFFTVDMEKNNIVATLQKLHTLPTKNIVYGTGMFAEILISPSAPVHKAVVIVKATKHVTVIIILAAVLSVVLPHRTLHVVVYIKVHGHAEAK